MGIGCFVVGEPEDDINLNGKYNVSEPSETISIDREYVRVRICHPPVARPQRA